LIPRFFQVRATCTPKFETILSPSARVSTTTLILKKGLKSNATVSTSNDPSVVTQTQQNKYKQDYRFTLNKDRPFTTITVASMKGSYVAPLLTVTGPVVLSALTADKVQALKAQNKFEKPRKACRHRRKLERNEIVFTVGMGSIGGLAMLTGLIAMYIEASFIAYIAFSFPILAAPYSIHQRRRLNRMPSLVDEINKVRIHVKTLAGLNIRLQQENDRLAGQVGRLADAEENLQQAVQKTGGDVNEFQRLVRENGETTRNIKVCPLTRYVLGNVYA
jgi:hypothetical protein